MVKSMKDSRTAFQIKLAEAQANGQSETALLRERLEELNKIMAENANLDLEQTRKLAHEKRQIQKSLLDAMIKDNQMMGKMLTDTGEIITNVMKIAARNQKESSEFEKSMALFNIAVQTGVAISNSIATAMKHGKNPVMAIATMLSMIATVT